MLRSQIPSVGKNEFPQIYTEPYECS